MGKSRQEMLAGVGPCRTWWAGFRGLPAPLGATIVLAAAVGDRYISTRAIYLFSLGFDLSMGESFQKD